MKAQKNRPIGKLAEALLLLEASNKAMDTAQIEFNESLLKAQSIALAELEKPFDTQEKIVLWRNAAYAGLQVSKAQDGLSKAQNCLAEILDQMRPGAATVTATNKNRVPFVNPEMGNDWDEVQEAIAFGDDKLQLVKWQKSTSVEASHCKHCRRLKASLNADNKPSKAKK
jgi:hypothetical protein